MCILYINYNIDKFINLEMRMSLVILIKYLLKKNIIAFTTN